MFENEFLVKDLAAKLRLHFKFKYHACDPPILWSSEIRARTAIKTLCLLIGVILCLIPLRAPLRINRHRPSRST